MMMSHVEPGCGPGPGAGGPLRVLVVGAGPVGLTAAVGFAHAGHHVVCAEQDPVRCAAVERGTVPFLEPYLEPLLRDALRRGGLRVVPRVEDAPPCEAALVAVGTPPRRSGEVDLRYVVEAVRQITRWASGPLVLAMKSTVPPGTGAQLERGFLRESVQPIHYAANPEFLREGHAVLDWFHPARTVVGSGAPEARAVMRVLYRSIDAPLFETDVITAEMAKYASNAFLAAKVSFINEIAALCESVGADVGRVAEVMGADPRIGPGYLRPGVGYGGSCFPKDTRALEAIAGVNGHAFRLLKAVIEVNEDQPRRAVQRVATALGGTLEGIRVAVLGVAFKPGTDDVRESPALEIAALLHEAGAQVVLWDPQALGAARALLRGRGLPAADAYEACAGAHAVMVLTAWPEFSTLDWPRIARSMVDPRIVFDGRNCLPDVVAEAGVRLLRVGRSDRAGTPMAHHRAAVPRQVPTPTPHREPQSGASPTLTPID